MNMFHGLAEAMIALPCGAFACPIGGFFGYKIGNRITEKALRSLYHKTDNPNMPSQLSWKEKKIKCIGGGALGIISAALSFVIVTSIVYQVLLARRKF